MRALFIWWGRRGAMVPFTLALARAAKARTDLSAAFSVSREGALASALANLGADVAAVSTFGSGIEALRLDRLMQARAKLAAQIDRFAPTAIVVLMGHVWTSWTMDVMRRGVGTRVGFVLHDARAHPGDATARVTAWINRPARRADRVLCLSTYVAESAVADGLVRPQQVRTLFHPVMAPVEPMPFVPADDGALRVLFFGRLHAYRGLAVTVDAVARLRAAGRAVRLGVFGEGDLAPLRARLSEIDAEVENRWIAEDEIAGILARHDVMALSHVEASQSGAAALALGAGMPLVVTPVGALPEQIGFDRAGITAASVSSSDFAAAVDRMVGNAALREQLRAGARQIAAERSPAAFLDALSAALSQGHGDMATNAV